MLFFVALPIFVYARTRSAAAVASVVLIEGIGLIVGGILAQRWVDRVRPVTLLVAMDLARAIGAGVLAAAPSFGTAIAATTVLSAATGVFSPVSGSVVPRLVADEALEAANGLQWTAGVILQLVAAPIAGFLVTINSRAPFAADAASFLVSAAILKGLPELPALSSSAPTPWLQIHEVFRVLSGAPVLGRLITMQAVAALGAGATSALLVVLASSAYRLNGTGYGFWLAAIGVGALFGPLLVPTIRSIQPAAWVSGAYIVRGVGDILLGSLRNGIAGAGLLAIYGINTSSGMVAFQTMVQREVSPDHRGRAFATLDVTWQSARLASIAAGGAVAATIGIRALFVAGGTLLIAAGLVGAMGRTKRR